MDNSAISFQGRLKDFDTFVGQTAGGQRIEEFLNDTQATGCSLFFITCAIISYVTGKKQSRLNLENAQDDRAFELELKKANERYEDSIEAENRAFQIWFRNKQREFLKEEAYKRIDNEYRRTDLQMFFDLWPLEITIEAINQRRKQEPTINTPMSVVIGKHINGEPKADVLASCYFDIVDRVKTQLKSLGIIEDNVYRFKRDNKTTGGPSIASVYGMMSNLPTVMLVPRVNLGDKKLSISLSSWFQDSTIPFHKTLFKLDYDPAKMYHEKEYVENKISEIVAYYTAIPAVLNDVYTLLECGDKPKYPSYALNNAIFGRYPELAEFAKNEYSSLIQGNVMSQLSAVNGQVKADELKKIIEDNLKDIEVCQ